MTGDIEKTINGQPGVETTVSTIGQGSMRFILTYSGQRQYSNYAQIMVRMDDQRNIPALTRHVDEYIARNYPQVNASTKRVMFGPSGDSAIEIRIKGPDPDRLRLIASHVDSILTRDPATDSVRNDWQNRSKVIRPQYVTALGRELGVDKQDVDNAPEMNFSGSRAGLYREGSDLLPVVVRPPESERLDANHLNNVPVWSQTRQQYIPLSNVVSGFALEWEDPLILRRDRSRVLTVQTDPDPLSQQTSGDILARVKPQIDALPLPHGYSIEWGGDAENSSEAQQGLFTTLPLGYLVMFVITVLMFSSVKNAVAIWLTVPLALIGVTPGFYLPGSLWLYGTDWPAEPERDADPQRHCAGGRDRAAESAAGSAQCDRLRRHVAPASHPAHRLYDRAWPRPLLLDVFFQSMAVVIMFGLGFATILTLLVLPVIYACFHRKDEAEQQ